MDQEIVGCTPPPRPEAADACGCTPRTPSAVDAVVLADHPIEPSSIPEESSVSPAPRRSLKLVVTLTPAEAGQYRATLALGADGCDPVLRSVTVSALSEALDQVPNLVEEAQAHWRLHPRNPTTVPATRRTAATRTRSGSTAADAQAAEREPRDPPDPGADAESSPSRPATNPVSVPARPTGDQLTLFG